jgi:peptidoglycan/LPS O-acetylase OafA/YrhL
MLEVLQRMPVVTTLAAIFYCALIPVLFIRPIRLWFRRALNFPRPSGGINYRSLDAFRGLAALWVALFHSWQWTEPYFTIDGIGARIIHTGNKAVPIFVMLSGFLIWRSVTTISDKAGFVRYIRNRFLRIYPLYAVVICATLFAGRFGPSMPAWQELLDNLLIARSFGSQIFVVPQYWSLYVEIIFYLAVPAFAFGIQRNRISVFLVAALLFALAEQKDIGREFALWKYFFFGIFASEIARIKIGLYRETVGLISFVVGTVFALVDFQLDWFRSAMLALAGQDVLTSLTDYSLGLGIAYLLIILGAINSQVITRILSLSPLHILGVISYSIFSWGGLLVTFDFPVRFDGFGNLLPNPSMPMPPQYPGLVLICFVIPALISVGLISFLLIERPFLVLRGAQIEVDGARHHLRQES